MKTYEIFTEDYSEIMQAENIFEVANTYNGIHSVIAIIELERGQEFLTNKTKEK